MASGVYERVKGTQLRDPFEKLKSDINSAVTELEEKKKKAQAKIENAEAEIVRLKQQLEKLNKVME